MRVNLKLFCAILALFGINLLYAQTQLVYDPTFNPDDNGEIQSGFTGNLASLNSNLPHRMVKQPDGKILLLNHGTMKLHGVTFSGIVRVNADGTLDQTFNAPFNSTASANSDVKIFDALVQADGKIVVCGEFNPTANNIYGSICRLNPDGTLDQTFNAGRNLMTSNVSTSTRHVYRLQQDAAGLIYIAGNFQTIKNSSDNEITCKSLAILNPDGTLNTTRSGSGAGTSKIDDMIILSSGKILLGGDFTNFDGYSAMRIIRLNSDLTLDHSFNYDSSTSSFLGYTNNNFNFKLFEFDNKVYIAHTHLREHINNYRGTNITRKLLVRLNDDGSMEEFTSPSSFFKQDFNNGNLNGLGLAIFDIAKTSDNNLMIAGRFKENVVYNPGVLYPNNKNLTKITLDGEIVPIYENATTNFKQNWNDTTSVRCIAIPNDSTILAITYSNATIGKTNNHFVKFNENLEEDQNFIRADGFTNAVFSPTAKHINAYSNTEQIVSGKFHSNNTERARFVAKLDNDGNVTATLPNYTGGSIHDGFNKTEMITSGPNAGKFMALTNFATLTNIPVTGTYLNRYNADGTLDNTFVANTTYINGAVRDFTILDDGRIFAVGHFSYNNGNSFAVILNSDGSFNSSLQIAWKTDCFMNKVKKDALGRIYIGGRFKDLTGFGGLGQSNYSENFIRINADLTHDATFGNGRQSGFITPPAGEVSPSFTIVEDFIVMEDGSIIVIGNFKFYRSKNGNYSSEVRGAIRIDQEGNFLNNFPAISSMAYENNRLTSLISLNSTEFLLAGNFLDGSKLKRFNINGTLLETYHSPNYETNGTINHLAKDPSGRIYLAGDFSKVLGANKNGAARFIYTVASPTTTQTERTFCENKSHLISDLLYDDNMFVTIYGTSLKVYDAPTGGNQLNMSDTLVDGNYYYFSQTINGTESASRLAIKVNVNPVPNHLLEVTSCQPLTYNYVTYNTSTSVPYPKVTFTRPGQCDSIVHIKYTRISLPSSTQTISACDSYTWNENGTTYTSSTIDSIIVQTIGGCDSTIYLNLTINNSRLVEINETACGPYTWPLTGETYNTSGVHYDTLQTVNGCDSIIKLNLIVSQPYSFVENKQTCTSYTWPLNGETYSTDTTVVLNYTSIYGCDSTYTLNVSITAAEHSTQIVSACESYTWPLNGQTYTTSTNTPQFVIPNGAISGCDSIVTLNLTIYQAEETTIPVVACDEYTWPVTGLTYDQSGIYSHTLQTINGCDSIVKLDLTINQSTFATQNITACGSYIWPINNVEYLSSTVVVDTIPNAAGCDSIITLNLTINQPVSYDLEITACDEFTWSLTNQTYTTSTTDQFTFVGGAANGCDSTVNLILTINQTPTPATVNHTACSSYTWPINNQMYDETGIYTAIIPSANGCDSLITLNLTITPAPPVTVEYTDEILKASIENADSYQWYDCSNDQAIAGATSATYTPTANGQYKVVVETEDCISTSSCVTVNGLSIKQIDNSYISIAPNPAHSAVQIKTENVADGTAVVVLDETGRIIYETAISNTSTHIEIESWARGVYYVKVGSSYVEKLIKN